MSNTRLVSILVGVIAVIAAITYVFMTPYNRIAGVFTSTARSNRAVRAQRASGRLRCREALKAGSLSLSDPAPASS